MSIGSTLQKKKFWSKTTSATWNCGPGSTVPQPSRYRYRYVCSECHARGDELFDTPEEALGNGLWHVAREHQKMIQVEPVGVYD